MGPCRLLLSNSTWSAGCRRTGVEREDAVFVCRCLPLLPSKWKRPVGSSACVYLSLSEGSNKAWKCCPQAVYECVCVCVRLEVWKWQKQEIKYCLWFPSLQVHSGQAKKMCHGLAFRSWGGNAAWICVWQEGQTDMWQKGDKVGEDTGTHLKDFPRFRWVSVLTVLLASPTRATNPLEKSCSQTLQKSIT